ncbi:MAG: hypothetical protein ACI9T7_000052 [Oleiphilaceae bacterium]|jgi:hypothetical protein
MLNYERHNKYDAFELAFMLVSFVCGATFFLDMFTGTNGFSMYYIVVAIYAAVSSNAFSYIKGILAATVLGFIGCLSLTIIITISAVLAFFAN